MTTATTSGCRVRSRGGSRETVNPSSVGEGLKETAWRCSRNGGGGFTFGCPALSRMSCHHSWPRFLRGSRAGSRAPTRLPPTPPPRLPASLRRDMHAREGVSEARRPCPTSGTPVLLRRVLEVARCPAVRLHGSPRRRSHSRKRMGIPVSRVSRGWRGAEEGGYSMSGQSRPTARKPFVSPSLRCYGVLEETVTSSLKPTSRPDVGSRGTSGTAQKRPEGPQLKPSP